MYSVYIQIKLSFTDKYGSQIYFNTSIYLHVLTSILCFLIAHMSSNTRWPEHHWAHAPVTSCYDSLWCQLLRTDWRSSGREVTITSKCFFSLWTLSSFIAMSLFTAKAWKQRCWNQSDCSLTSILQRSVHVQHIRFSSADNGLKVCP